MMRLGLFYWAYPIIRRFIITCHTLKRRLARQPMDLEGPIEFGAAAVRALDRSAGSFLFSFPIPDGLHTRLFDLEFPSPLTAAAYEGDLDLLHVWFKMGLGGICLKTALPTPRPGNSRPRIQEVQLSGGRGLLNAMGLPGPGAKALVAKLGESRLLEWGRPIGFSIGGNAPEDYLAVIDIIEGELSNLPPFPTYYEINISCPNTPEGKQLTRHPELLGPLIRDIRAKTSKVIGIKVSPDQSDAQLAQIAEIAKGIEWVYINAGNTTYRACTDVGLPKDAISIGGGGLSGRSLFPRTREMARLFRSYNLPIISTGGIATGPDAACILAEGATLVGMATGIVQNAYCIPKINCQLYNRKR